jgi:hypothetical protein
MRNAPALVILILSSCFGGSSSQPATLPSNQTPPPSTAGTAPPAAPTGLAKEVCAQRATEFGAVPLQADQVALRRGTGVKTFADLKSTREEPIEVCMPQGERGWITSVTCSDGSKPSASGRSGSVGAGGVCGSIIDLYTVTCPEKEYEVFMDMYMCPPGEGT